MSMSFNRSKTEQAALASNSTAEYGWYGRDDKYGKQMHRHLQAAVKGMLPMHEIHEIGTGKTCMARLKDIGIPLAGRHVLLRFRVHLHNKLLLHYRLLPHDMHEYFDIKYHD